MAQIIKASKPGRVGDPRVHMANERTFLSWVRTSIGIMAFGFVVEKFTLFLKQISYVMERTGLPNPSPSVTPPRYTAIFGIFLVGLGALMGLLAFVRYKKVEREIEEDNFQPSLLLDVLLVISVLSVGMFLVVYLIYNI